MSNIAATVDRLVSALDTRDSMTASNSPKDAGRRTPDARGEAQFEENLSFGDDADFGEIARRIADFRRSRPDPVEAGDDDAEPVRRKPTRSGDPAGSKSNTDRTGAAPSTGWNLNWRSYLEERRSSAAGAREADPVPRPASPDRRNSEDRPQSGQSADTLLQNRLAALRARASGMTRADDVGTAPTGPGEVSALEDHAAVSPVQPAPQAAAAQAPPANADEIAPAVAFAKALLSETGLSAWQTAPAPAAAQPAASEASAPHAVPSAPAAASPQPEAAPPAPKAETGSVTPSTSPAPSQDAAGQSGHDYAAWAALAVLQKEQESAREARTASAETAARAEKLASETASRIQELASRLGHIGEIDLAARFDTLEAQLVERAAAQEPLDFTPLAGHLETLERRFDRIEDRLEEQQELLPPPVDLAPMAERLELLDGRFDRLEDQIAGQEPAPPVDLAPIIDQLHAVEDRLSEMERVASERHDAVCELLSEVLERMKALPDPTHRLEGLTADVDALVRHANAHETNLESLSLLADAFDRLETRLSERSSTASAVAPAPSVRPAANQAGARRVTPESHPEEFLRTVSTAPAHREPAMRVEGADPGQRRGRTGLQSLDSGQAATQGRAMSDREAILARYRRQAKALGDAGE